MPRALREVWSVPGRVGKLSVARIADLHGNYSSYSEEHCAGNHEERHCDRSIACERHRFCCPVSIALFVLVQLGDLHKGCEGPCDHQKDPQEVKQQVFACPHEGQDY